MALRWADRILETSTTTGTGALALAGAVTGYRRFSAIPSISTNDTVYYAIFAVDTNGNPSGDWETGLGTYSAANELTRTTPSASTNGGAAVSFAAGTKWVIASPTATLVATLRNDAQGTDVASSGTISIGDGGYFFVTGTTTITDIDFATDNTGRMAWVKFSGALILTHNSSTLILPGGTNITTAAGDTALFRSEGSDAVRCIAYQRASGAALASSGSYIAQGTHTIPLMAASMTARTTNGAALGISESSSNKVMLSTFDFDGTTAEYVQIMIPMPKSWDEGTVTAQFIWAAPGGTGNVVWGCQAVAISDDDVIDASFGSAQTVTDGVTATTDIMESAFTSAITIAGTPAAEDIVCFQFYRDAANGSDTLNAIDAKLIAVRIKYTVSAGDDS